ncbi:MAG: hypothetical protein IT184_09755 [Acidobacteria bacterium]|nr:hypothetical protein [Acidobacteriota bacterium]
MAENSLPEETSNAVESERAEAERRAFLRKAALVGLPVVLATVRPRAVWAGGQHGGGSCAASIRPSKTCK